MKKILLGTVAAVAAFSLMTPAVFAQSPSNNDTAAIIKAASAISKPATKTTVRSDNSKRAVTKPVGSKTTPKSAPTRPASPKVAPKSASVKPSVPKVAPKPASVRSESFKPASVKPSVPKVAPKPATESATPKTR